MPKFQIELDDVTIIALTEMAVEELRDLPKQAAWVLMQAMRERTEKQLQHERPLSGLGPWSIAKVRDRFVASTLKESGAAGEPGVREDG